MTGLKPIAERGPIDAESFAREVVPVYAPVVLRGQLSRWPAVAAGRQGPQAIAAYLAAFDRGQSIEVMVGAPEIGGKFFYADDMRGFNFHREPAPLPALLAELLRLVDAPSPPSLYAGSAATADHAPGWERANPLGLPAPGAAPRIWIGNASRVATHHDVSHNLACVVAGRRRFTLFPPDQIANLYVGPLETTLAGQPTSMVDLEDPDFARYPRFRAALETAQTAELLPGDVLFIPSLWWHHVAATAPLNVLVNYWWGQQADISAFPAMIHALLSVRDLDRAERDAWRGWFEHYVFGADATRAGDHLPAHARGVLAPPSPGKTQLIKDYLIRALNRS